MEYATLKLTKFWQAEDRQRVNDVRLQEHFIVHVYMRSYNTVQLHRKWSQNFDVTNVRCDSYMHCVQRNCRLAEEKRLPSAKNVRRYFT